MLSLHRVSPQRSVFCPEPYMYEWQQMPVHADQQYCLRLGSDDSALGQSLRAKRALVEAALVALQQRIAGDARLSAKSRPCPSRLQTSNLCSGSLNLASMSGSRNKTSYIIL